MLLFVALATCGASLTELDQAGRAAYERGTSALAQDQIRALTELREEVVEVQVRECRVRHALHGPDLVRGLLSIDGGPAAKAGLRPGDVIVAIDDARIETVEDLFSELRQRKPGSRVRLTIIRDGRQQAATVTLADRPN